mmetsp:Transcript_31105/g.46408  ORF Transcript_31105/g.46408 Transcript_31105/m.46408 type:complete len:97 (+) Transcript_31105:879-1169(+)
MVAHAVIPKHITLEMTSGRKLRQNALKKPAAFGTRASILKFASLCVERPPPFIKTGWRFTLLGVILHPLIVHHKKSNHCGDVKVFFLCYVGLEIIR